MPVIKITKKDIDRSKPPSDGWHLFKIDAFSEDKAKDKQSDNWVFELVCIEPGENEGRYAYGRFNSKAPGMLIGTGFLPSALDRPIDEEMEFNPSELVGKTLYGNVTAHIYEGKPQKRTEQFAPASSPPF